MENGIRSPFSDLHLPYLPIGKPLKWLRVRKGVGFLSFPRINPGVILMGGLKTSAILPPASEGKILRSREDGGLKTFATLPSVALIIPVLRVLRGFVVNSNLTYTALKRLFRQLHFRSQFSVYSTYSLIKPFFINKSVDSRAFLIMASDFFVNSSRVIVSLATPCSIAFIPTATASAG